MTILWNEVTTWWNEVTKGWNEVVWNEVVMERSGHGTKWSWNEVTGYPLLSFSLGLPLLVQSLMTWKMMSKGLERFCLAVGDSAKDDSSSTGKLGIMVSLP